jgi:hypothetical protein
MLWNKNLTSVVAEIKTTLYIYIYGIANESIYIEIVIANERIFYKNIVK